MNSRLLEWAAESVLRAAASWPRAAFRTAGALPLERPRRILFFGYAAIGDAIFLLPVLEGLRKAYPQAELTFLANRSPVTLELIPATGLADRFELVDFEGQDASRERDVNAALKAAGYDLAVLSLSSPAHFFQKAIASIPYRAGHCTPLMAPGGLGPAAAAAWKLRRGLVTGELSRRLLLNRKAWVPREPEHAVLRNLRLLTALRLPIPERPPRPALPLPAAALDFAERALGPRRDRRRIAVHLGFAGNPYYKIWPAERFGRLLRLLHDEVPADFVLVGGAEEAPSEAAARNASGLCPMSFVGRSGLLETFALISRCDLFIGNDTALAKAAMALGIPTATLWGPIDERELGTLWDPASHLDFRREIPCAPCARFGMPLARAGIDYTNCGHHACLRDLAEGAVFDALRGRFPFLSRRLI